MLKSILNLAQKEGLQLLRDRLLLGFLIIMPVMLTVLIGSMTGSGIRKVKLAVWDQDRTAFSQSLVQALTNAPEFVLVARPASYTEFQNLLEQGSVSAGLIIPQNFSSDTMRPGGGSTLPVVLDGSNEVVASTLIGSLNGVVNQVMADMLKSSGAQAAGGIDTKIDIAFNATLNLRWSVQTGQIAMLTYLLVLVVAAVSFVRERELGTIEQLVVTPISRLELILGKALLAYAVGLVNLFLIFIVIKVAYDVPMRGDFFLMVALGSLFIFTEIGIGMLISLLTKSQQQAILIVFLLAMMEITFSGYLVPADQMPPLMSAIALFSPMQHFMAISRSIILKGSTLPMLWQHVIPLVIIMFVSIGAAWYWFNKVIE